jgi:GTP pyrophosphokinase
MENEGSILRSLKYIENHLDEQITLESVAGHLGYSVYHFSRIFKTHMGVTVMEYVRQRKLIKASEDILNDVLIIDVAIKNGYQTHSGFTKAFKKEFGFSPALLKAFKQQLKCIEGGYTMEHVFMKQPNTHTSKEELYTFLTQVIEENKLSYNMNRIRKAYELACTVYHGMERYSGEEYVTHPLNVGIILAELEADEEVVIAGMLCDSILKTSLTEDKIASNTSDKVKKILVQAAHFNPSNQDVSMMEEVILLKLAERLHNMRTVEFMDEKIRIDKAKETIELFMPFCKRIGNEKMMSELSDLALKYVTRK